MRKAGKRNGNGPLGSKAEARPPLSFPQGAHNQHSGLAIALWQRHRNDDLQPNGIGCVGEIRR
jgi:hypothetical protein